MSHRTRVKICGITSAAEREMAVAAGADAIGVICDVTVQTPREVSRERARTILAGLPPFVTGVLVTMPEDAVSALRLSRRIAPDAIQLHGDLDETDLQRIGRELPVIRAVDVDTERTIDAIERHADAILLDSADDQGAGGTGRVHDWERASQIVEQTATPVVLAGGLTPQNVAEAVERVAPFAVDVASGVESNGGKDEPAVRSFVTAARGA